MTKAFAYLTRSELAKETDSNREKYKEHAGRELDHPRVRGLLQTLPGPLLDLGSGNGRIFSVLSELGVTDTHGADIEDYLSLGNPTGSFKTFDFSADRFPYEDNTFGSVTAIEVIEHLENPYHFLREVARILKPDGIFVLSTPNPKHLYNRFAFLLNGEFYRFLDGNDHIMLFAHYILSKGALPFFDLISITYLFGEFPYRFLSKFSYPENQSFGRTAVYVLRKA